MFSMKLFKMVTIVSAFAILSLFSSTMNVEANPADPAANPTPANPTPANPTPANPTPANPTPANPTPDNSTQIEIGSHIIELTKKITKFMLQPFINLPIIGGLIQKFLG
jgi:hypothetical protein